MYHDIPEDPSKIDPLSLILGQESDSIEEKCEEEEEDNEDLISQLDAAIEMLKQHTNN